MLDIKPAVIEAIRSPEVCEVLLQLMKQLTPANDVVSEEELVDAPEAGRILKMTKGAILAASRRRNPLLRRVPGLGNRVRFRRGDVLALVRRG